MTSYPSLSDFSSPAGGPQDLDTLDVLAEMGDVNETPFNVFIGHNLGHRVFTMSVPFRKFTDISAVANDRDAGPVSQRALDEAHAKKLAVYMMKGLVSAAKSRRISMGKDVPDAFNNLLNRLGDQPYFSLQPLVCNIRNIPFGGNGPGGIRGIRLETATGETAAFKVFLSERHVLWVVDGQHRRYAANLVIKFLEQLRQTGKYPSKGIVLMPNEKGTQITESDMQVWNEAYDAARSFSSLTVEVHLGLDIDQERQLFHDLNRLGKKVDSSLAFKFDGANPITQFIKRDLKETYNLPMTETEPKDWSEDKGALVLKDLVAVNAIAFLNKSNIGGATPAVIEPREPTVLDLWGHIRKIPHFCEDKAREKTVAAQPVVMKAFAKLTYDLNFSNRRPADSDELYARFLSKLPEVDFSHSNPMWNYYGLTQQERKDAGLEGLSDYLPDDTGAANRDIGALQGGYFRFGAKHNDIYPILADMLRWALKLPSRR